MAATSTKQTTQPIDEPWENQDSRGRLRTIEQLGTGGKAGQQSLIQIARTDEHERIRCGAVKYIQDLDVLLELQNFEGEIQACAAQQYYRILAGSFEAGIGEATRLQIIRKLPSDAIKQIALLAKCKAAADQALSQIDQAEDLADLTLLATSVHVRKNAALKIQDIELLSEIREKVRNKDKTVFKVLDKRLSERPGSSPSATPATQKNDSVSDGVAVAEQAKKPENKQTIEAVVDLETELPKLEVELAKLSHKNTARLNAVRDASNRLRKAATNSAAAIKEKSNTLHNAITEKLDKNRFHQEQLKQNTESLLKTLKQALEDGQSHDALPAWDKIQGNISNTSGKLRTSLQKQANVYKAKLNELRDWKVFAATEKKKGLIKQMQHLTESRMHATDRSKHISKMHQDWKFLGRSNQNEQLWREFKKLSDKAYEPCKEYFKQRKQLMVSNLKNRREICDKLEQSLVNVDKEHVNISDLNKLLNTTDKEWKQYAPIEQSKIKSLQKRFYATINKLRRLRKNALHDNSKQKQNYISQARVLGELEDNQKAMNDAKRLQQEWKNVGPTSYKEDKKYWEDFRKACDKIFEKRNLETSELRENLKRAEDNVSKILQTMESIFDLDDDSFRKSRNDFQDLAQRFATALDPGIKKQRNRLLDRFNELKRKIDARLKSLPNKKRLLLKNALLEKSNFLKLIEKKLLLSKDDNQFIELKSQVDNASWKNIESSGNAQYEEALQDRLQRTIDSNSLEDLRALALDCEAQARALCIELEIRANIDTPKQDQQLRMQIQLDQLKKGFGQSRPDQKENTKYAMEAELQSYCLGPMEEQAQQELFTRLQGAIKKLM